MKLGIVNEETWAFFTEVHAELSAHHATRLFEPRQPRLPVFRERTSRFLAEQDLQTFLRQNDVVFFEWASERLAQATRLSKQCGIVTRLHRYELYQWADDIRWGAVDRLILVSEAKRREFAARFPDQAAKIVVIPEAISLKKFQPAGRPFGKALGILCHLSPRKRVYELILAFDELRRRRPGFHLHIGGGPHPRFPEYPQALRALVDRLGLSDNVTFHGKVARPEEWYPSMDIFISNSYSEGLQVAPMEAIASGCYALSHAWDGADELLPSEDIFFGERDFITKVLAYADLDGPARVEKRSRQLAIVQARFDVDRTKVRIREVVEDVAARREGRRAA
ncbi:MAG TPA: glycosyltransferase family 4 protein [Anaerolineales bacterium]|nr:glycosyltransferase family 4 protein [Anaerolineales bacterium]